MSRLYLYHAVDTIAKKGKETIISFAKDDEQRMLLMKYKCFCYFCKNISFKYI